MSKQNHTPGPWEVMYATSPKGECTLAVWSSNVFEGYVGSPVCKVSPQENENATDRANAHLIAAAPELLEALQKIVSLMPEPDDVDYDPGQIIMDVERIAYAAIAKATGKKEKTL